MFARLFLELSISMQWKIGETNQHMNNVYSAIEIYV